LRRRSEIGDKAQEGRTEEEGGRNRKDKGVTE